VFFDYDACLGTVGDIGYTHNTTLELTGGADLTIHEDLSPQGTATVTLNQSTLEVDHDLMFLAGTPSLSAAQASLVLGRMFQHSRQTVTQVALGDSTVLANGAGGWPFQAIEAAGLDVSTICGVLADDNFGFGQLRVGEPGNPTTVRLYDIWDNGHRNGFGGPQEALYLFGGGTGDRCARPSDGLFIEAGSTLELNCRKVYAWDASASQFVLLNSLFSSCSDTSTVTNGAFGPGTIRMVPEPGMLGSLFAGIALVGALRRNGARRRAES
jgi:hypothetical protein